MRVWPAWLELPRRLATSADRGDTAASLLWSLTTRWSDSSKSLRPTWFG
ncbi:hypothetical protein [uncultured Roseovarius sp.]|nr:hypothetical protein [uncultured Roseovarius sp.]